MLLIQQILEGVLIPLLIILTRYLVSYFNAKREEAKIKVNNELAAKYIDMVYTTVTNCVIATNQTYVDALKGKNMFDTAAQKEAFKKTFDAVKTLLSEDAINYITELTGDADLYLTALIEAEVNKNKGSK